MYSYLLSPKMDFVFKKIFGNEQHPEILVSFLNAVIDTKDPITSVEIKNTDIEKDYEGDKFSRLDIKAITDRNEQINVEIQLKNEYDMIKRSLYYWGRMYTSQLTTGGRYRTLKRTVCINILDFKYLDNENYHNVYRLKEVKTDEELTNVMEIHFIEIPKLKNSTDAGMLEAWISFLQNPNDPSLSWNEQINEAKEELIRLSANEKDRIFYEKRMESMIDWNSSMENGREQGRAEGRAEGREQGRAEGKEEAYLDVAKEMLEEGMDIDTICKVTKLSREIVEKLFVSKNNVSKMNLLD